MSERKVGQPTHHFAPGMFMVSDIVQGNGKTFRENNLEKTHAIPLGSLVEVKFDSWHGDGACEKIHARLWVVLHERDCDGTPLYYLSTRRNGTPGPHGGFSEGRLKVVEVTRDVARGEDVLTWGDDDE